jgi:hypothetical protein
MRGAWVDTRVFRDGRFGISWFFGTDVSFFFACSIFSRRPELIGFAPRIPPLNSLISLTSPSPQQRTSMTSQLMRGGGASPPRLPTHLLDITDVNFAAVTSITDININIVVIVMSVLFSSCSLLVLVLIMIVIHSIFTY